MSIFDQWDWIRVTLAVLIVACNWGVWRGVALEESLIPWEKETGKRLLIRSLALEFFFALLLVLADTAGSIHQKSEIAALNAEIAPRRLQPSQQEVIGKDLASFAGKSVFLASYVLDVEGAVLLFQIKEALEKVPLVVNPKGILSVAGEGGLVQLGIHITGKDQQLVKALLAIIGQYQTVSPDEPFPRGFISYGSLSEAATADAFVFVGVKPIKE
jgi:hypothetical protein